MRRVNRCLNTRLIAICQHTIKLEELSNKVRDYLPESLREQCQVGSFNKGCLVLVTHDPVWASQLRYSVPELRDKLRQAGIYQLTSIKITIGSEQCSLPKKQRKIRDLSANARETIMVGATQCDYLPLKQALYHLIDHHTDASTQPNDIDG